MKLTLLTFALMLASQTALANDILQKYCDDAGGKISQGFTCPKSKLRLGWKFCTLKDPDNKPLFFDGCTGPSGGHTELFYSSCIKHDYCYHHEPATNGYERIDCDKQFLANATSACVNAPDRKKCEDWAKIMYQGLRAFGELAFHCANYKADYQRP